MTSNDQAARRRMADAPTGPYPEEMARQIDRLVSGDLPESQRSRLLQWLDADPARWRRCGQAFLEAQALRETFAEIHAGQPHEHGDELAACESRPPARRFRALRTVAATAAALAFAFLLGWMGGHRSGGERIAESETPSRRQANDDGGAIRRSDQTPQGQALPRIQLVAARPVYEFTLPVVGGDLPAEHWARQASIPSYVRSRWESQGFEISERQRLVPVKLPGGKSGAVAVNRVKLTYVGRQSS